jgi:hypothetical protein
MKITVTYDEVHDCLVGKYVGRFEPGDVREYGNEIIKLARIHNCKRFLNDMREAEIKLSITDLYYASAEAIMSEFDRDWKRAIVVKEKTKEMEFYEITASNKGLTLKVFDSYEKALAWL